MGTVKLLVVTFVLAACVRSMNGELKPDERVVLVSPVLAPPNKSRARVTETAKDYPVLMLLATENNVTNVGVTKIEGEPQPIYYVKKLEDQHRQERRRRRFSKMIIIPTRGTS